MPLDVNTCGKKVISPGSITSQHQNRDKSSIESLHSHVDEICCGETMIPNWLREKKKKKKRRLSFVGKAFERRCIVNLSLLRMISKLLFCLVSTCERSFILFKRQSEDHWLRSLLSVHSLPLPPPEEVTHKSSFTQTNTHTHTS